MEYYIIMIIPIFKKIPEVCPICGQETKVKKDYDTEVLICTNPDCEGKFINKLDHYCGKKWSRY